MPIHDFASQRLFLDAPLDAGREITLEPGQAHYLLNVLRMRQGDSILIFNGRDGEWLANLGNSGRRRCQLRIVSLSRKQTSGPDIDLLFAPLKRGRLDYMVQKACELGVACLRPVLTRRTIVERVNLERMRANVIEAAEQCGVLRVPEVLAPQDLRQVIDKWDEARLLFFCDEVADGGAPLPVLMAEQPGPVAVLVGPEGGFEPEERDYLLGRTFTRAVSLGPRIMRADTAATAMLSLVNAVLGDWRAATR